MNFAKVLTILVGFCRLVLGLVIIYAGAQLISGDGLLSNSPFDSGLTGAFVILIGLVCVIGAVRPSILQ